MATFVIGGLWHGAGWTFIVWGALHGIALAIHRVWQNLGFKMWTWLAWFITFDPTNKEAVNKVLKAYAAHNGITLDSKRRKDVFNELAEKSNMLADFDKIIDEAIKDHETRTENAEFKVADFWKLMNAVNDFALNQAYEGGQISKAVLEETKARYKYFVPLRGHEAEAEKAYDYTPQTGILS